MACLYLNQHRLHEIDVIWANTGKNYPEALETIAMAREMCRHWHEVKTDRDAQWNKFGLPSDLVPVDWTSYGQIFAGQKKVRIQNYMQCCFENLVHPTWLKSKELGNKFVIRGQRKQESHKAPPSGEVDGVTFIHPIEDWTTEEVLSYLKEKMGRLPEHYKLEHSSMDCFDCSAFAAHSLDRAIYTKEKHPELFKQLSNNVRAVWESVSPSMAAYENMVKQCL